jgi:DNA-binding SARP family transcriptional activator
MLGSLEVFDGAEWVAIGAAKARLLLAVLLVRSSRVVSTDELIDGLWGERPPRTATSQVHGYVMRLRRTLGDREGRLVRTVAPGYQLAVGVEDVDALVFGAQVDQGYEALRAGQPDRAAEVLGRALALWRGPALADVAPIPLVTAEASRLGEQQLAAREARVDAELACGRHALVISELQGLVADHPLCERLWGQLMVALHRSGRQAESLQTFARVRRVLIDEVGAEPCAELQRLHQLVLSGDGDQQPKLVTGQLAPVCQLPADIGDFTGREKQLGRLRTLLTDRSADGPPPVVVISGGPGVGKSTLAVHAAHRVAVEFDDGQLYLDLAGTSGHPRDTEVMLGELLSALGVTGAAIQDGTPARATLFRSLLSRRRLLVVLDDAAHSEQIRPLLPANGGCAVVVTSRRLLTDLVGARHVEVDLLAEPEAHRLLSGVIGPERMAREPEEAAAIVRACACLPLALRVAAGKLVGRPTWPLRLLRERLEDQSRRLGELGVRDSFEVSVDLLPADAVRALRLLGLLGPVTVPGWVLGPLLDRPVADDVLDALVDANLLRLVQAGADGQPRYRLSDLLRAYALEGAQAIAEAERRDAMTRLLAAWLDLLTNAVDRLPPSLFHPPQGTTPRRQLPPAVVDRLIANPQDWFEAERHALLDAVRLAVDWRRDEAAWELAATAVPYYDQHNHYEDWRHTHELALDACRQAGNLRGEAIMLRGLAQINIYRDEYDTATTRLHRCLALFQRIGDKRGERLAIASLGTIHDVVWIAGTKHVSGSPANHVVDGRS